MGKKLKILAVSNLFPNKFEPNRGLFNFQLIKNLNKIADISVVAPVPYYPGMRLFPAKANFGRIASNIDTEKREGIILYHPRYFSLPKILRSLYGYFYYVGVFEVIYRMHKVRNFDAILSSFAYPDGYAVHLVAKKLKLPHFITVLGSDIYMHGEHLIRRKLIRKALIGSKKVIAMSRALKEEVVLYGIEKKKVIVNYNGIDREIFKRQDKIESKQKLSIDKKIFHILFVGNIVKVKGLDYLINAVAILRKRSELKIKVYIIGQGKLKEKLVKKVSELGLENVIEFVGEKKHTEIAAWMNACDVLCLPSLSEGVPNVVLEAMSCGTPIVATMVGGIPEVVKENVHGFIIPPKDSEKLATALLLAEKNRWNHSSISDYADKFRWNRSAKKLYNVIRTEIIEKTHS
jgi:glycosyltransferase involved in cell wall biosynthesis